ncbi:MAG: TonB-dependent receptor [Proteobacteria bacterium]|nr:TonB-dependent receptor [Pseudomonadota bacterium]
MRTGYRYTITAVAAALSLSTAAWAEEANRDASDRNGLDATSPLSTQEDGGAETERAQIDREGETIVVIGRAPALRERTPQRVTVIGRDDLDRTVGVDATDALKKSASVDVVQYPGALSGVGIRGFRPELGGTNKHILLLIDGRPAGTSNLATIPLDDVERIELLKGPGSALYGGEAMGGVVNVVRRRGTGEPGGRVSIGAGSSQTWQASSAYGGRATDWLDFDVGAGLDIQSDDMPLGDGTERAHTEYQKYHGRGRVGFDLSRVWRVDASADYSLGRGIQTPGDIFYGDSLQGEKDLGRFGGSVQAEGRLGRHSVFVTAFGAGDTTSYRNEFDGQPAHKSFEQDSTWLGTQGRYVGRLDIPRLSLTPTVVTGIDVERVHDRSRSFTPEGDRTAPFSPDANRTTVGVYGQGRGELFAGRLVLTAGARFDHITQTTLATPFKTDFTPDTARFWTINPSAGVSAEIVRGVRPHTSFGMAFVPPQPAQMAGYAERNIDGVTMTTRGNPDLDPERSWTWDGGIAFTRDDLGLAADLTVFITRVRNKIESQGVSDTETTYVNFGEAEIQGWEGELSLDVGALAGWRYRVRGFAGWTHVLRAQETSSFATQDIHNVADLKVNYGLEVDDQTRWNARLLARHRGEVKDTDWNAPGYPEVEYPSFTIVDLVVNLRPAARHLVTLELNNLFDKLYYEKLGFPLMGRVVFARYALEL